MTVPPEVLADSRQTFLDIEFNEGWKPALNSAVSLAYGAGAAAERDRIRTLAIAHAAAADTQASSDNAKIPGATLRRFADLLADDQP
jgi:hypothetical protein